MWTRSRGPRACRIRSSTWSRRSSRTENQAHPGRGLFVLCAKPAVDAFRFRAREGVGEVFEQLRRTRDPRIAAFHEDVPVVPGQAEALRVPRGDARAASTPDETGVPVKAVSRPTPT